MIIVYVVRGKRVARVCVMGNVKVVLVFFLISVHVFMIKVVVPTVFVVCVRISRKVTVAELC